MTHDLPSTLRGWPVRWERLGSDDDGDTTRDGWTAVIDGARLRRPVLSVSLDGEPADIWPLGAEELDGQPLGALADLALMLAHALVSAEIRP